MPSPDFFSITSNSGIRGESHPGLSVLEPAAFNGYGGEMETRKRDFAIIGGGPGGYTAAIRAAKRGASVVLFEKEGLGGTCLLRGCIPTKSYVETARAFSCVEHAAEHGIDAAVRAFDFGKARDRKNAIVERLGKGVEFLLKKNKVEVVAAAGRLGGSGRVEAGGAEFEARTVIIAAGSEPAALPGLEADGKTVLNSDHALDLDRVPKSMLIVGGGVIGCEFSSIFSALGCEVTIVEILPRILAGADGMVVKEIERALRKRKVKILVSERIASLAKSGEGATAALASGKTITAEKVLVSVGRKPASAASADPSLGLAGPKGFIAVDEFCRTGRPGVMAIGDVTGGAMLAHRASHMGMVAVDNAMGHERKVCAAVPSCIFTTPEASWVGLTEDEAAAKGLDFATGSFPFRALGRAQAASEIDGMVKFVCLKDTKRIVGFHAVGAHATDLVAEGTLAVRLGLTAGQIEETIHAHPTFPEAVAEAAADVFGMAVHI